MMCSIVASIALAWTALSHAALEQARRGRRGPLVRLARHLGTPAVRRALVATAASVVVPSVAHAHDAPHAHAAQDQPSAVRPVPIFGGSQAGGASSLFARTIGTDAGQHDDEPAPYREATPDSTEAEPVAPPSPWDVGWGAGPPSDSWAQRDSLARQPQAQEPQSAQRHTEAHGQSSPRASRNKRPQPQEKAAPSSQERGPDRHSGPPRQNFTTPDRNLAAPTRPFTAVDQPLARHADSGEIAATGPGSAWDIGWGACPSLTENGTASTCAAGTEAATQARAGSAMQASSEAVTRAEAGASAASRTRVVQPGESLWDIASSELPPDASEPLVSSHVSRWFEANRAILSHPDRIYPGQALTPPEGYS
ncbi:MAG: hypothetical protein Q3979_02240 [Actinomycetaceae bacterium]|nr:hypothetical protein [Actinomycetaceae bacterium]